MTHFVQHNGQIPTDPITALFALLASLAIAGALPTDQLANALVLFPYVVQLLPRGGR